MLFPERHDGFLGSKRPDRIRKPAVPAIVSSDWESNLCVTAMNFIARHDRLPGGVDRQPGPAISRGSSAPASSPGSPAPPPGFVPGSEAYGVAGLDAERAAKLIWPGNHSCLELGARKISTVSLRRFVTGPGQVVGLSEGAIALRVSAPSLDIEEPRSSGYAREAADDSVWCSSAAINQRH